MREAVIVAAARTPVGRCRGALASVPAHRLGALALGEAVKRAGIAAEDIEEVIFGNLMANEYANLARVVSLEAGLPYSVPAITVDRQCASSLSALGMAAALIVSGQADVVATGGVESDSRRCYVMEKPTAAYQNQPPKWANIASASKPEDCISMGMTAENLAEKYGISRAECDAFAVESHRKAAAAWQAGRFDSQIVPVEVPQRKGEATVFAKDEALRPETSMETLAKLPTVFKPDGVVTAGNSSPMSDGAGAVIVMLREKAEAMGLPILAKFTAIAAAGVDPKYMGYGPVAATQKLLKQTGRTLESIDLIEMNEAFAAQSITCLRELKLDESKLNVNGGALALGHPLAGTGAILVTKMVYELARSGKESGLITFCVGGGQGVSALIERV